MIAKRLAMMIVMLVAAGWSVPAYGATSGRDCDSNAIMYCGALTKAEFNQKIAHGDTVHSAAQLHKIYFEEGRGITPAAVNNAAFGTVYKDGRIVVSGKVVATNALSYGREFMAGSTKAGAYWKRPTSVSMAENSLPAFVDMTGGTFHWAVIEACGNMVTATPVMKPTPSPTQTTTPVSTPSISPSPSPQVLGASTQLPDTGAVGLVTGLAGGGGLTYGAVGWLQSRSRLKRRMKQP